MSRGVLIAAPASGSGKTTITLGLLRRLRNTGVAVGSIKVGPDYIDPAFHAAATGRPCFNLDAWAMRPDTLASTIDLAADGAELIVGEGVMGLFDGAPDGMGSTSDLAERTGWPVVLVVDAGGQAQSAAATVFGFARYRPATRVAGVIFNRIGGPRHGTLLRRACAPLDIPVLGCLPRSAEMSLPDRHLGLVQAAEHPDLEAFIERAAGLVGEHVDVGALAGLAASARLRAGEPGPMLPPLGQRIAVARDIAFAFTYPARIGAMAARGGRRSCPFPRWRTKRRRQTPTPSTCPAAIRNCMPGGWPRTGVFWTA